MKVETNFSFRSFFITPTLACVKEYRSFNIIAAWLCFGIVLSFEDEYND